MKICPSRVVILSVLMLFIGKANFTIVLENNGYTKIVVAISENVPQPPDNGAALINDLKALLTETSAVLFQATGNRVYFKNIDILLPPTWTKTTPSTPSLTSTHSYQLADIRLTNEPVNSASGSLPYTWHSGKCGVNGNFITLPTEYLEDVATNLKVQAKGLVQQWAQLRYGVFEEHGYPNDELLPYFYRHPNGYDAVTSSNDTEIKGTLEKLSGGNCEVNENGIISDQGNCRFVPTATEQTATTSLMSFHWLDTVIGFSEKDKHDRRPPHRQNRLCNSKSSAEVMANSPDFNNVPPNPNQVTTPEFQLLKNLMLPVVYVAMDTSFPANPNNTNQQAQNLLKRGVKNLFFLLINSYPETLVAYSTFENIDFGPEGSYLKEEYPPKRIADGYDDLGTIVDNFVVSQDVLSRDVSAVIRDGEARLRQYKDTGGSILYLVTSTDSVTNDTVIETDLAERLMQNNIKLVVAETGLTMSQVVKYSEDYEQLLNSFEAAPEATIVFGSLNEIQAGTAIAVYVSAPYTTGKSVYFVVETTATNSQKSRSHVVWTESNPPENAFTTPGPTTEAPSTTTQESTSSTTSATTSTTESPIITSTSTADSSIDSSTTQMSSTTDVLTSIASSEPTSSDSPTPTDTTSSTVSTSTTGSTASTSTTLDSTTISSSTSAATTTSTTTASTTTASTTTASTTTASTTTASTTTASTTTASTTTPSTTESVTTPSTATTSATTHMSSTTTESPASSTTDSTISTLSTTTASTATDSTTESVSVSSTLDTTDSTISVTSTEDPGGDGDGLTSTEIGYIVGGVVGGIVVIGAITGGVILYKKKHGGGGGSMPPSTSNNGRSGPSERAGFSNTPYPPSTPYTYNTTPANANNGRQVESFEPAAQNNDRLGITFEDEDMCMTAM
ncbi:putative Calcium-activated chloride channel regulator 1/sw [Daphnia magna]|uniref:Putative Calcium-activated chloride channel regulator 1/sw n=1 Tax=Daphnia magna TaxID=35525 RepID=A0A164KP87_9CRUS|nr:putative Calcium-activated chloride channel regulator 1/sw [Daphnia magna]